MNKQSAKPKRSLQDAIAKGDRDLHRIMRENPGSAARLLAVKGAVLKDPANANFPTAEQLRVFNASRSEPPA